MAFVGICRDIVEHSAVVVQWLFVVLVLWARQLCELEAGKARVL